MSAGVCASGVDLDASRNVCKTSSSTMAAWMVSPETTTSPRLRTHSGKSRESANPRATVRKTLARDSCESSRAVESVARNTTRAWGSISLKSNAATASMTSDQPRGARGAVAARDVAEATKDATRVSTAPSASRDEYSA